MSLADDTKAYTFKDFLITEREVTVTIDPDDPAGAKQKINNLRRNPDQAARQAMVNARDDKAQAQKAGDAIAAKIAALRMQIKQLEAQQARLNQAKEMGQ